MRLRRCRMRSLLVGVVTFCTVVIMTSLLSMNQNNGGFVHNCNIANRPPSKYDNWSYVWETRDFENGSFGLTHWSFPCKSVVILTYQRCGSTFLGSLFNSDPHAFYVFEPLDALYSSLYGTQPGWNVPSDIVSLKNGAPRTVPQWELSAVSDYLASLLTCNVDRLPTDALVHPFWNYFGADMSLADNYTKCLQQVHAELHVVYKCYKFIQAGTPCTDVFGKNGPSATNRCHQLLHPNGTSYPDRRARVNADRYRGCMSRIRSRVNHQCSSMLTSACSSRPLRVVKVVRATMQSMERLLNDIPESYVIHLVRDPRAVTLSRYNFHASGRGAYTKQVNAQTEQLVREASIYCRQVVADVRWRRRLERQFAGRLYSLTYEQLVDDPVARALDIYRFIGADAPTSTVQYFTSLAATGHKNVTGKELAMKWQKKLTSQELKRIHDGCRDMLELFPEYTYDATTQNSQS